MGDDVRALLEEIRDELRALRRQVADDSKALLSQTAAAKILGIERQRLGRLVAAGLVRTVPGAGKRPLVPREEVERLAKQGLPRAPGTRGRPRKPPRSVEAEILAIPLPGDDAA